MTTDGQPTGYYNQTYAVEFEVSGELNGVTPSPNVEGSPPSGQNPDDPQNLFRVPVENLGLVNPEYTLPDQDNPLLGTTGNRLVTYLWIEGSSPGDADASVDIVDATDGTATVQKPIGTFVGDTDFYREGIFVPQGSMIRVRGMTGPVKVRLHIQFLNNAQDLAKVLAAICCLEANGNGPNGGGPDAGERFSVNSAEVNGGYSDNSIVLRTGAVANPTGAFVGESYLTKPRISGKIDLTGATAAGSVELALTCEIFGDGGAPNVSIDAGAAIIQSYMYHSRMRGRVQGTNWQFQVAQRTRFDGLIDVDNYSLIQSCRINAGMTVAGSGFAGIRPNGILLTTFAGAYTGGPGTFNCDAYTNWWQKTFNPAGVAAAQKTIQGDLVP